jgi:hypothetical protein
MARPLVIPVGSLEYVRVPVYATSSGAQVNPTGDVVQMAFLPGSQAPESGDWKTASWDTDATTTPTTYRARCLVGPAGTVTLTRGTYTVWVKITDSPEVPVRAVGSLKVI